MRIVLILLRIGVLLTALGGVGGAAFLGGAMFVRMDKTRAAKLNSLRMVRGLYGANTARFRKEKQQIIASYKKLHQIYPLLLAAAGLGLLGGVLAVAGYDFNAALLLLVAAAGPALFGPVTLLFTFALPLAGFGSLLVGFIALIARVASKDKLPDEEPEPPPDSKSE